MADVKWIKITTDIFSDEKILLIEQMPDADCLLVIWFKLLCMAGKENNYGVFLMRNRMPYTEEMLATIFRRPLNTVRLALSTFEAFGMIEIEDDVICIPNWEKHQNIDGMEKIREQNRIRKQKQRERQKQALLEDNHVKSRDGHATDKNRIEENRIEEEKEEDKDKKKRKDNPPTVYYPFDECLNQAFVDYVEMRKRIKKPLATERAITLAMNKLDDLSGGDNDVAIQILEQSIMNSWQGLFPLKQPMNQDSKKQSSKSVYDEWRNA